MKYNQIEIDGVLYNEIPEENVSFKNVCRSCAFYGTDCYNRDEFSCHSDSREDGKGVVFKLANPVIKATGQPSCQAPVE